MVKTGGSIPTSTIQPGWGMGRDGVKGLLNDLYFTRCQLIIYSGFITGGSITTSTIQPEKGWME